MKENKVKDNEIDWYAIIIPLVGVIIISILFLTFPRQKYANDTGGKSLLGNQCGIYYAVLGLGIFFAVSMAFSEGFISVKYCWGNRERRNGILHFGWG